MEQLKELNPEDLEELVRYITINEEDLPGEWLDQPSRYLRAVAVAARYEAALSRLKLSLETHESSLTRRFKSEGIEGIARVTDDTVKAVVQSDPETVRLKEACIEKHHMTRLVNGLVRALEMRERSLKYVQLAKAAPSTDDELEIAHAARRTARRHLE